MLIPNFKCIVGRILFSFERTINSLKRLLFENFIKSSILSNYNQTKKTKPDNS